LRTAICLIVALVLIAPAFARQFVDDEGVLHFCGAPLVTSGEEFERVSRIARRLSAELPQQEVDIVLIDSRVVNAWTVNLPRRPSLVCIPTGLVRWQTDADGELAFIIGHELGHARDESCKTRSGRARLASRSHSLAAILFGPSQGDELGDLRGCEFRADAFGLELLTRTGFNPADAVTAFERLQQLQRDHRRGIFARLSALGSDHPITADRIDRLRSLIRRNTQSSH
jgi:beta-barrel assembly-enhancing protease